MINMRVRIILGFLLLFSVLIAPSAYAYWVNQLESQWTLPITHEVNITVTGVEEVIAPSYIELGENVNTGSAGATITGDYNKDDIDYISSDNQGVDSSENTVSSTNDSSNAESGNSDNSENNGSDSNEANNSDSSNSDSSGDSGSSDSSDGGGE